MPKSLKRSADYKGTLQFWKALEDKYKRKKAQWLKESQKLRKSRTEMDEIHRELQEARRASQIDITGETSAASDDDEEFIEPAEEFSDVDLDTFVDPGARYYSSLDPTAWQRIKDDVSVLLHVRVLEMVKENPVNVVLLTMVIFGFIILYMLYVGRQVEVIPEVVPKYPCEERCATLTFLEGMLADLFGLGDNKC